MGTWIQCVYRVQLTHLVGQFEKKNWGGNMSKVSCLCGKGKDINIIL